MQKRHTTENMVSYKYVDELDKIGNDGTDKLAGEAAEAPTPAPPPLDPPLPPLAPSTAPPKRKPKLPAAIAMPIPCPALIF